MSISPAKKIPLINKISHQEVQLIFGLSEKGAKKRITVIRASLERKKHQILTVMQFCSVEGITLDEFDVMVKRAMSRA